MGTRGTRCTLGSICALRPPCRPARLLVRLNGRSVSLWRCEGRRKASLSGGVGSTRPSRSCDSPRYCQHFVLHASAHALGHALIVRPRDSIAFMARRCFALVLALCFGLFWAEALIADVHDGDAPASEQTRYSGASDASPRTGAPATTVPAADLHTHSDDEAPPPASGHSIHACHSGHAHVGLTAMGVDLERPASEHVAVLASRALPPADAQREPHLRPPIV